MAGAVQLGLQPSEYARMTPGDYRQLQQRLGAAYTERVQAQYQFVTELAKIVMQTLVRAGADQTNALLRQLGAIAKGL